ncbi:hypothetical protein HDU91_005117, partial [Kappamyces sp. JEL0680]
GILAGALATATTAFVFMTSIKNDHNAARDALKNSLLEPASKQPRLRHDAPAYFKSTNVWASSDHYNTLVRKIAENLGRY